MLLKAPRAFLIRKLMNTPKPYVINWTSFYLEENGLSMIDPFKTYLKEAKHFFEA